ncbi:MAG: hypothetical protein II893_02485 [Methanomicrobium sp.]|nr:hypothetical protein [Methanomicrobium sp.]MBQ3718252.1 hypothetical protein [Methanomicrobium sp.]MBQ4414737.1 hypothetical protein [Methanomicrobium sp.]
MEEELPEYNICPKCGRRSTPYSDTCWYCHTPFFPNLNAVDEESVQEPAEEEIETVTPCRLAEMNFAERSFAYKLLLTGEILLEFCDCDICKSAYKDLKELLNEAGADLEGDGDNIRGLTFDMSVLNL